jgi:hypothetical protein
MPIFLCGLVWVIMSVMMARPGFFNYCVWRAVADKSKLPEQIYLAAKPKLLSRNWLYWTLFTTALACTGAWLFSPDRTAFLSQAIGIALLLIAFGLLLAFHIIRAGRIWNDVAGTA